MMPKPNQSREDNCNNTYAHEQTILETRPNILLYSNNFVLKIVVLFILVFLFAPLVTLFYNIQNNLLDTFQLNFTNMTSIMELILLFCILIVIIKIGLDILDWKNTMYTFTRQRIIIERGFFRKEKIIMSFNKIQDIEISQSIIGRILNAGDIIVYGGHDNSETILDEVPNPREVEELIINCMNDSSYDYNRNYSQNNSYNSQNTSYYQNNNYNQDYPQNNQYFDEDTDAHYYNNDYNTNRNPRNIRKMNKYTKGRKNNRKYEKSKINENEIISKHQQRFKKYKK